MMNIDNELVAFISEEISVNKEDAFVSFNTWLEWNYKSKIEYDQFSISLLRLTNSNRVELSFFGNHDEFVSYSSNIKTNSIENLKIHENEIYNKRISDLNRIMNFLIIKGNASSDDLIYKFCYRHDSYINDLSEEEMWSLVGFLQAKKCIKEERIDNYSFLFTPLHFSIEVFKDIEEYLTYKKETELEAEKKVISTPLYKTLLFFIALFSICAIGLLAFAYTEVKFPILLPVIMIILGFIYRKKMIGEV